MLTKDIKTLLLKSNEVCTDVLYAAVGHAVSMGNYEVTVEHFLLKLCDIEGGDFPLLLAKLGIEKARFVKLLNSAIEEFDTGNSSKPSFSPILLELFESAWILTSIDMSERKIRSASILAALIAKKSYLLSNTPYGGLFDKIGFDEFMKLFWEIAPISKENEGVGRDGGDSGTKGQGGEKGFIDKYCNDFTKKAKEGKIDAVFGRDDEIRQIIDVLSRRRKNNPICVGEPGVGKTAVVEGLALRVTQGDVPDVLKNVRVIELDIGLLEAGASVKGEFEKRLKGVIDEIRASEIPIITFIDEAHTLIGAGNAQGGSDAANLLKPALARGELKTVAATTWSEYKKYFEKDPALARRFQPIKLDEPSVETTTLILSGIKEYYEKSHGVTILSSALKAAAELSSRYINGRFLPDKAIDLLDTACARVKISISSKPPKLENKEREAQALEREIASLKRDEEQRVIIDSGELAKKEQRLSEVKSEIAELDSAWQREKNLVEEVLGLEREQKVEELEGKLKELQEARGGEGFINYRVEPELVAKVVSDWTGIPLGKMIKDESETILNLEQYLGERVKGQEDAHKEIAEVIRASKGGVKDGSQPIGVFLLVGPSGVGKTETGLTLAQVMFGSTKNIVTINMSEFQESHTTSRLVGSPPGYVGYGEGGLLTEAVRQKPYSVVLLDEVEKAHPDVLNLFYQVFDKGVLSDGEGKEIDFKNTVIMLTSNLASEVISRFATRALEEGKGVDVEMLKDEIAPALKSHFKLALYARMNIVPFLPLTSDMLAEITKLKLQKTANTLLESKKISLSYDEGVVGAIVRRCDDSDVGARNIDYVLNKNVLPKLSKEIIKALSEDRGIVQATISTDSDGLFDININ